MSTGFICKKYSIKQSPLLKKVTAMEVEIKSSDGRFVADVNIGDPDNPMIEVHDANVLLRFDGIEVRVGELTSLKSSEQG